MLHTYDDWKAKGFQVKRGEKGQPGKRKDGKALFSDEQVKPSRKGSSGDDYDDAGFGFDHEDDFYLMGDYIAGIGDR